MNMVGASETLDRFSVLSSHMDGVIDNPMSTVWEWNSFFVSYLYSCKMIRKYAVRFSNKTKYVEDRMFLSCCLYFAQQVYNSSRYLYVYRYNSNSAMHTKSKLSSIRYYTQIINGWVDTEQCINGYSPQTKRVTSMGSTLAAIYFFGYGYEALSTLGFSTGVGGCISSNKYYYLFENMVKKDVSIKQYKEHLLLKNHHTLFKLKHNLLGIFCFFMERAYRISFIKMLYICKKYPLKEIPKN